MHGDDESDIRDGGRILLSTRCLKSVAKSLALIFLPGRFSLG